ncbi:hypothetical protein M011DRAFT_174050 [Sporormia fimetaria CBS 119925]|uniref:C2H2-type domain-containing protein n=1 Tax=Sporormia fimetaria CBS 119925 TaxID=1340428 RepID=A0A6A6VKA4_9PLEO|nr:hypothetical protein M011DRAFT_174050 [Sporormia fimetaria CBS 119925]
MISMDPFQYPDLPQVPVIADEQGFVSTQEYWGQYPPPPPTQRYGYSKGGFLPGDMNSHSMQPMDRFLRGVDPSPFSPGIPHSSLGHFKAHHLPITQYGRAWQSFDSMPYSPRNTSPDRTSTSGTSSYAPPNELGSPSIQQPAPFSGTDNFQYQSFSYPSPGSFYDGPYSTQTSLPEHSINLRDLEINREEQEAAEEADTFDAEQADTKPAFDFEQDPALGDTNTTTIMDTQTYETYQDTSLEPSHRVAEEVQPIDPSSDSDPDYDPSGRSQKRRKSTTARTPRQPARRSRKDSSTTVLSPTASRVSKRRAQTGKTKTKNSISTDTSQRPFPCPLAAYGCISSFTSKNEWKRHVSTQHIKLSFWRCSMCPPTADPHDPDSVYYNDFNRKDLFTQHLRRMHGDFVTDENLAQYHRDCYIEVRDAPLKSQCLYCSQSFDGKGSWEERMEHVGRHLEKDKEVRGLPVENWERDRELENWLVAEGLVVRGESGEWKIGGGRPKRGSNGGWSEE